MIARRAAERMTDSARMHVAEIERQFECAAEALNAEDVEDLNSKFHEMVAAEVGNPEAAYIVNRYQELLRAFRRAYGFDPGRLPGVIGDHRALLACFAGADADGAAAIAAAHAAKARTDLIAAIRGSALEQGGIAK